MCAFVCLFPSDLPGNKDGWIRVLVVVEDTVFQGLIADELAAHEEAGSVNGPLGLEDKEDDSWVGGLNSAGGRGKTGARDVSRGTIPKKFSMKRGRNFWIFGGKAS